MIEEGISRRNLLEVDSVSGAGEPEAIASSPPRPCLEILGFSSQDFYSKTSSTRARNVGEIVKPSAPIRARGSPPFRSAGKNLPMV